MATANLTRRRRKRQIKRLRKQIAALENDRARLMSYARHMKKGEGTPKYLNRRLGRGRRRAASGFLLEAIEARLRRLRDQLAELTPDES
jgi:hypothetical protein